MTKIFSHSIFVSVVFGILLFGMPNYSAARSPANDWPDAEAAWRGKAQVEQCAWCHYQPGNKFAARPTDFCRLSEASHWLGRDPHATSRLRIEPLPQSDSSSKPSNARSRRIVDKLGYQVDSAAGYQRFVENCLTCHAGARSLLQQTIRDTNRDEPGISCVYCHTANDRTEWIDLHGVASAVQSWRPLSPELKQAKGMRHLASADAQAKLCFQCHIGDLSQGMFVSHAMYVAGHPPLPSVELHELTRAMSPHWRSSAELYQSLSQHPEARDQYFALNVPGFTSAQPERPTSPGNWAWQTQTTAIGALQAERQWLTLMEQSAAPQHAQRWADYALYDCSACHHGLQSPSPRQQIKRNTPPGRPLPVQWSQALERVVTSEFDQQLSSLRDDYARAITIVPFGQRDHVARAARNYRQALEELEATIAAASLRPAFTQQMLTKLRETPESELVDIESARQFKLVLKSLENH